MKLLEIVVNVAVLCVAVLFGVVLVKDGLRGPSASRDSPTASVLKGKSLEIPGVEWTSSGDTLVLALSTGCHFCGESLPFYSRVSSRQQRAPARFRLVAVLPEPAAVAEAYLARARVAVDKVVSLPLNAIGVDGTPTLLLVDRSGVVKDVWIGRLPTRVEQEVLASLE